jgi:hypothetical protein
VAHCPWCRCRQRPVAAAWYGGPSAPERECVDQRAVVAGRKLLAASIAEIILADAVDNREHGADQRAIRHAAAGTAVGKRILGGVAQGLRRGRSKNPQLPFTV